MSMRWINYLNDVTGGDRDAVENLQAFAGYCLRPYNHPGRVLGLVGDVAEVFLFAYALSLVVGPCNAGRFGGCFLEDAACRNRLRGLRLACLIDFRAAVKSPFFRSAVMGLPMPGEPDGRRDGWFVPRCKFVLMASHLSHLQSIPMAIFDHTMVVQFHRPERPMDAERAGRILQEMAGIRAWALEGRDRIEREDGWHAACSMRAA